MSDTGATGATSSRRAPGRRLAVLLVLVGAAVVILAATRVWANVEVPGLSGMPSMSVRGRVAASAGIPVALACGAGAFVLLTSASAVRLLVALGLLVAGALVAWNSVAVGQDTSAQLAIALRDSLGLVTSRADDGAAAFGASFGRARVATTAWPWVAALGGVSIALGGLLALVRGRSWPGPGARFERSVAAPSPSTPDASGARTWDALSRGEDPT